MGQWVGSGEGTHYDLLWDLEPYLCDCRAPPALLLVLLRLSYCLDLWGALGPTFAPVLAWVCLALLASDEASELGGYNWESDLKYL